MAELIEKGGQKFAIQDFEGPELPCTHNII